MSKYKNEKLNKISGFDGKKWRNIRIFKAKIFMVRFMPVPKCSI